MKTLKVVVSGSRAIKDATSYLIFKEHMSESLANHPGYAFILIISGDAQGVDQFAKRYASENNFFYKEFKPLYRGKVDRGAPLRRNEDMAKEGDIVVALWDGESPGTRHMMNIMEKRYKKPVYLYTLK